MFNSCFKCKKALSQTFSKYVKNLSKPDFFTRARLPHGRVCKCACHFDARPRGQITVSRSRSAYAPTHFLCQRLRTLNGRQPEMRSLDIFRPADIMN